MGKKMANASGLASSLGRVEDHELRSANHENAIVEEEDLVNNANNGNEGSDKQEEEKAEMVSSVID
jgi:hypothetical protein